MRMLVRIESNGKTGPLLSFSEINDDAFISNFYTTSCAASLRTPVLSSDWLDLYRVTRPLLLFLKKRLLLPFRLLDMSRQTASSSSVEHKEWCNLCMIKV